MAFASRQDRCARYLGLAHSLMTMTETRSLKVLNLNRKLHLENFQLLQGRRALVSMTHVYGHNKLVYNNAADGLAKVGAARSTVHRASWPRGPAEGEPRARRQKHVRTRGVKRQAALQTSESDSGSEKPIVIRHRRREMCNVPMDIPDPEPD